ncbi:hypothetical protein FPSE5266_05949 [Fusarium pseudograminearum]|nr:hypothetical protein FPSE5266_05949 [Fusarium pseudograminearum]
MGRKHVKRQATPQAPVSETAMRQVLGCYETFYLICTFMDMPTLLHAQLVSKHWHDMISTSPLLQQNLFLKPRPSVNIEEPSILNPLLLKHFEKILKGMDYHHDTIYYNTTAIFDMGIANMKDGRKVHKAFIRRDASWRRMLIAQPPITSIGYVEKVNNDDENWRLLPFPEGLCMGDLYDMVFQAIWGKPDEAHGSAYVDFAPFERHYYNMSDHMLTKWKEMPPMVVGSLCEGPSASPFDFTPLTTVMRLIGNIYDAQEWSISLQEDAESRISQLSSSDPVQVQCRLLYSIALFWSSYTTKASEEKDIATNVALELGMHKGEFASASGAGDAVLMESWRRTWWMLYIVDAYYAGTLGTMNFKTFHVEATVSLPCEEDEYESCYIPEPRTVEDFDSREFAENDIPFSSFAYLIGAVRAAALAISVTPKKVKRQDSERMIQVADAVIDAWLLLLPKERKVMRNDGSIDELMFQANLLVHVATIGLHRPLSDLRFNPIENVSSCAREAPTDTPRPDLINVHTRRILKSIDAQIQLLALPVRPFHHTPFSTCMVSEGTLSLLSACKYLLRDKELAIARDQIRLTIGCLKSLGEVWTRTAKNVKEIQTIARHVLVLEKGNTVPGPSELPSLTGSDGRASSQSTDVMAQNDDALSALGSLTDICGWINMGSEFNYDWMGEELS